MKIDVSIGEVLDKISILKIKLIHITDPVKIDHCQHEYDLLLKAVSDLDDTEEFINELFRVNGRIWSIEDDIRKLESVKDFSNSFVELARGVYYNNDKRFKIKNDINIHYNSSVREQKQYDEY